MFTTAGLARLTASANERREPTGSLSDRWPDSGWAAAGADDIQCLANTRIAAATKPTKVHLRKNPTDDCKVGTMRLRSGAGESSYTTGRASKRAERYVYNAQFLA